MEQSYIGIISCGLLLRFLVALHGYSGEGKPPLYGDYEAQRHWMEITYNLPVKDWYFNTSSNDLNYWGLDYPPLTAYHSWLCGVFAQRQNPEYVELYKSRGFESYDHKNFMRMTVIVADILFYISGVYLYFKKEKPEIAKLFTFIGLIYPGIILIDHGHFQYNCVSLGLALFSIVALKNDSILLSAILFCFSLSYKQMLLYYSLPFFFYLLGKCREEAYKNGFFAGFMTLVKLSITVLLTFLVVWFPFLRDKEQFIQVLHRIFPVARGIFEDKVSNIWCLLNLFFKFKKHVSNEVMAFVCVLATSLSLAPSCINILMYPRKKKFVLALINSSLAFFLFSYQVHEKSILIVALPVMLHFKETPFNCFWFLIISVFSMLPLFMKDKLIIPFISIMLFYIISVRSLMHIPFPVLTKKYSVLSNLYYLHLVSLFGCLILTLMIIFINPPEIYPDIFPLLISVYSALHFLYFLIYFNYEQIYCKSE